MTQKRQGLWRRAVRVWLAFAVLRALVSPSPTFAGESPRPLVAPLAENVVLSTEGRPLIDRPDGVTLASIRGAALMHPAIPVTRRTPLPPSRHAVPVGARFRILATGYSSTPDQTDSTPFTTASGTRVHDGTVAANFLPFGTRIRFLNYRSENIFVVEDRHSPRLSDRVDIWFASRRTALHFGVRVLQMEVVE